MISRLFPHMDVEGTYVADNDDPESICDCLRKALDFNNRTRGRSNDGNAALVSLAIKYRYNVPG